MRGRTVRHYWGGRTFYNLSPARAAQFAMKTMHKEEPPRTLDSSQNSLDMVSDGGDSPPPAHKMKTSCILTSSGRRKHEKEMSPTIKRRTRLSSKEAASLKSDNEPVEKMPARGSCNDDPPVCIVSYRNNRPSKKQVGTPGARLKNPKKERKVRKSWVSVPLSDMEVEGVENTTEKCKRVGPEANQSRKVDRKLAVNIINDVCERLLQKKDTIEIDDGALEELRSLAYAVTGAMCEVEHVIHSLEEGKLQRKGKEKVEKEATAAAEQEKLWDKITKLKLRNQTLTAEKMRILRERSRLKKEHLRKLARRAQDQSRLQIDRDKAKAVVAALATELSNEQDKSTCHICFAVPRDAIVLPCMHFQYCNECLQKYQRLSTDCPTCRGKISGVLCCPGFTIS